MLYQLDITLTEEDYLAFNTFHSLESQTGKKIIRNSRIAYIAIIAVIMVLMVVFCGWTTFTTIYVTLLTVFTAIYMLLFKKTIKRNIKAQVKALKKRGKLPFDPFSKMEFYEDRFVEITADKRNEQTYGTLERICVVEGRYIYLYQNSIGAHILPIPQIKEQLDHHAFLSFLTQKCSTVEYYHL